MLDWHLGTMGFGYSDWSGGFYPTGLKPADYLAHYAAHFDSVELDTTFHAVPSTKAVARWAAVTPALFRFAAKTPRSITHDTPPQSAIGAMHAFLDVMRGLGTKLGVVLLQFPPRFHASQLPQLRKLIESLPTDLRFAIEFRHPSWYCADAERVLRDHRISMVTADYENAAQPIVVTADFLYVRWVGTHGQFPDMTRERINVSKRLEWWKNQITQTVTEGAVWGFFNNDYTGNAIATCDRLRRLLGQRSGPTRVQEPTLFS